jgi:hypothetical protein
MFRALTTLAAAACLLSPVFAAPEAGRDGSPTSKVAGERMDRSGGGRDGMGGRFDSRSGIPTGESLPVTESRVRRGSMADRIGRMGFLPYPYYHMPLPDSFYAEGYYLTPRDYKRFRRMGFSRDEAYMIANAARATGLDPLTFSNAIYQGMYAREIAYEYNIHPNLLTRVHEEWRTPTWASAVGEPVYTKDKLDVFW